MQFHVGFNAELFELLESGALDFAVCGVLETPPHLRFQELLTTELVVIVRTGHPLTSCGNRPFVISAESHRGGERGTPVRQLVEEVASSPRADRPHAVETNSWEAILEVVTSTDLFSLAPRDEAMRHGWTSRLVSISIPEIVIHPRNGILTRQDAYLSPLAARAIELVEFGFADHSRTASAPAVRARRSSAR